MGPFSEVFNKLRVGGKIYRATNYDESTDTLPTPTDTNMSSIIATVESTYTFEPIHYYQNFIDSHSQEDENVVVYDDCDKGSSRSVRMTPSFNFDLFGTNDLSFISQLFPTAYQIVAAAPVVATPQVFVSGSSYGQFYPIANQNGDGTAPTITSLTEAVTLYVLVPDTDYVLTNDGGVWGIVFINSGNYNIATNNVTLAYSYTPASTEIAGYKSINADLPKNIFKFVACEDTDNGTTIQTTLYITKAQLTSQYDHAFAQNGAEQSAALTLTGDKTSLFFWEKKSI